MAREIEKLTALGVTKLKTPGRHSDGNGLYLVVDKGGAKRWVYLYRKKGLPWAREMGLGSVTDSGLAKARELAAVARKTVREGGDPIEARIEERCQKEREKQEAAAKAKTFGEYADEFIATHEAGWRNAKHK